MTNLEYAPLSLAGQRCLGRGKVGEVWVSVPVFDAVGKFFPEVGEQWIKCSYSNKHEQVPDMVLQLRNGKVEITK